MIMTITIDKITSNHLCHGAISIASPERGNSSRDQHVSNHTNPPAEVAIITISIIIMTIFTSSTNKVQATTLTILGFITILPHIRCWGGVSAVHHLRTHVFKSSAH